MKIHNIRDKIFVTALMLIISVIYYFTPIECIFLSLTGLPCPGCGMTRALLSAVTLNFKSAFSYHFMFWSVPILYICYLFDGRLFKSKPLNTVLYAVIGAGFAVNWILKLI